MEYLFKDRNVSVRTILNYKAAIAFYWRKMIGYHLPEQDPVLSDLIKGFKRSRPVSSRHVVEWDLSLVLSFFKSDRFKSWDNLSDKDITLKTVFLIALATGKRRSELNAFSKAVQWVGDPPTAVELTPVPEFVSKTHVVTDGLGALRSVSIPALPPDENNEDESASLLCPVLCLRHYLRRTDSFRAPTQRKLFISYNRGVTKDLSKQTLSFYIKSAVTQAYAAQPDTSSQSKIHVKPHSVRHVATSLSALKAFSLEDVLRAGAWASPDMFLRFYAQDFTVDSISKLSHLGGFVTANTRF